MPIQELVDTPMAIVDCADMASVTETEHAKLKERVRVLENQHPPTPATWVERHPMAAWVTALVLPAAVTILAIVFGVLPHLENDANIRITNSVSDALKEPMKKIDDMGEHLAEMKGELEFLLPDIREQVKKQISRSLSLPSDQFERSLPQLRAALRLATTNDVQLDPSTIQALGKRLSQAISANPDRKQEAWSTFVELVSQRSRYDAHADPEYSSYHQKTTKSSSEPPLPNGIVHRVTDSVFADNPGMVIGLDGGYWENVLFKDMTIRYNGGPVVLRNVRFENCRFEIPVSTPAHNLGKEILASDVVDFKHTGA